jgi:hypothetical protein
MSTLNLKKFKKIAEDKSTATFQHEAGHTIKIALSKLNEGHRKAISKLPKYDDGGEVDYSGTPGGFDALPKDEPSDRDNPENLNKPFFPNDKVYPENSGRSPASVTDNYLAEKAEALPPADGGDSPAAATPVADPGPSQDARMQSMKNMTRIPHAGALTPEDQAYMAQPMSSLPATNAPAAPVADPGPSKTYKPPGPPGGDNANPYQGLGSTMEEGIQAQESAINAAAKVKAENESQQADMYQTQAGQLDTYRNKMLNNRLTAYDVKQAGIQKWVRDNPINPDRMWQNKDTSSKISTGLGLVMSGMGSGLAHQQNLAYDMLMKTRDEDIAAQQANYGHEENMYGDNLKDLGSQMDAINMSKIMANEGIKAKLEQYAMQTQAANEKNNAQQAIGVIDQNTGMIRDMMNRTAGNHAQAGGGMPQLLNEMRVVNPKMAEGLEARYIPSVGAVADIPVPQAVRSTIAAGQDLDRKVKDLRAFSAQHSGSLSIPEQNTGAAMAALVQDAYRQSSDAGVFKESEKDFINSFVHKDPTAFFSEYRTDPGYKVLEESNRNRIAGIYQNYGIRPTTGGGDQVSLGKPNQGKFVSKTFRPAGK